MIKNPMLSQNLKLFIRPNYYRIIANGGNEMVAKKVTKELLSILNSISILRYPEFKKYLQIRKELGEQNAYLNSRIISVRGFAKFLKSERHAIDSELLNYPTFQV